jgi:metal-responsive CopG/Arc/MetJ family transcriptional regulator
MPIKVTTVRLEESLADELAAVARVEGSSVSDAVREAVAKHVAERRADPDFQHHLKKRMEADRQILEQLAA